MLKNYAANSKKSRQKAYLSAFKAKSSAHYPFTATLNATKALNYLVSKAIPRSHSLSTIWWWILTDLLIERMDAQSWQSSHNLVGLMAHCDHPQDQVQDVLRIALLLGHVVKVVNNLRGLINADATALYNPI